MLIMLAFLISLEIYWVEYAQYLYSWVVSNKTIRNIPAKEVLYSVEALPS